MGARCREENGFLYSEFLDYIKKFPLWNRTKYYCLSSALLDTATGRIPSEKRLRQLSVLRYTTSLDSIVSVNVEAFRLGSYQISITSGGDINWKTYSSIQQIIGGPVLIESGILFIGPKSCDAAQEKKQEFLSTLRALPQWHRTTFWSRGMALKLV